MHASLLVAYVSKELYAIWHIKSIPNGIHMENLFRIRLKEIRYAYKLSGYAFAKKINMPQPSYLRYEVGERKPSAELIEKLVTICGVNAFWLFTGKGEMFGKPSDNSFERQNDMSIEAKLSQIGQRLSLIQDKYNFLDSEMAKLLEISETEYIKIIVGEIKPSLNVLNKIKQNFKVSIDYLLYGE